MEERCVLEPIRGSMKRKVADVWSALVQARTLPALLVISVAPNQPALVQLRILSV